MEIYKLLVVDDEPIIVDGLYELFKEFKSYPLDVYRAYSGAEALEWLNKKRIDVVITDIKMPGVNGMQLLEKIRFNWPNCKVIFLTGYEEFEYVYKAIQSEGVSYLLKTETYESIVELVENYLEQIRKSMKDEELIQKAQTQSQMAVPILQREFLTELVEGIWTNVRQQQLNDLKITLRSDRPVILIAGYIDEVAEKTERIEKSNYYAVNFLVEKHLSQYASIAYTIYKNYMVWMIQTKKDSGESTATEDISTYHFRGILESVQAICNETLRMRVSFVLSNRTIQWNEIANSFLSLKIMFNYCSESGMEVVLLDRGASDGELNRGFVIDRILQNVNLQLKKLESLDSFMEQGGKEGFFNTFREIKIALVKKMNNTSTTYEIFYSLSLLFLSYMNRHGIWEAVSEKLDYEKLTQFNRFKSLEEAFDYFEAVAILIFEIQNIKHENRSVASVQKVQKYIQDHPGGDLSLSSLADMVYFNPKYLSRLFKQFSSMNLSDYILEVKLNKAKELLKQNRMKIHEIAEYVGYYSAPYFTRFFKRATNMTPQEYKDAFQTSR